MLRVRLVSGALAALAQRKLPAVAVIHADFETWRPSAAAFDAVVAPEGADLSGVEARRVLFVRQDGSVWSSVSS